jgi:hypothetical protein
MRPEWFCGDPGSRAAASVVYGTAVGQKERFAMCVTTAEA